MTSEGKTSETPLIYVVDDEPMLLELGKAILIPRGFQVQTYRDPESTLEVYRTLKEFPDLILTDYAMHAMTGMDLIREARRLNPKQKIILVSGTVDENIFRHATEKPNRFIGKPYDTEKLVALIREVIAE